MRWPWRHEAGNIGPACTVNPRRAELETAKEILAEIFHTRPADVEEMIQRRIEERSWAEDQSQKDGLWPATFCLSE